MIKKTFILIDIKVLLRMKIIMILFKMNLNIKKDFLTMINLNLALIKWVDLFRKNSLITKVIKNIS